MKKQIIFVLIVSFLIGFFNFQQSFATDFRVPIGSNSIDLSKSYGLAYNSNFFNIPNNSLVKQIAFNFTSATTSNKIHMVVYGEYHDGIHGSIEFLKRLFDGEFTVVNGLHYYPLSAVVDPSGTNATGGVFDREDVSYEFINSTGGTTGTVVMRGVSCGACMITTIRTYFVPFPDPNSIPPYWSASYSGLFPNFRDNATIIYTADRQYIFLNSTSGPLGSKVLVSGNNFTPSGTMTFKYDSSVLTTNPSTVTTNSTGGFSGVTFTVPSSAAGAHTVNASDTSGKFATATFTVPSASIKFDKSTYPIDSAGLITVNDPAAVTNPNIVQTVLANVKSSADTTGITITLKETAPGSGVFVSQNYVRFSKIVNASNAAVSVLKVALPDTVTGVYNTVQATATIGGADPNIDPLTTNFPLNNLSTLNCNKNTANDGICDEWKTSQGLQIPLNGVNYKYPCNPLLDDPTNPFPITGNVVVCPDPSKKDVYVEIDYLSFDRPDDQALWKVIQAFQTHNINLHLQVDEDLGFNPLLDFVTPWQTQTNSGHNFMDFKTQDFGTVKDRTCTTNPSISDQPPCGTDNGAQEIQNWLNAKRQVFHYALFVNQYEFNNIPLRVSGISEIPGNDFLIALGPLAGFVGSQTQQAAVFMHELGHNLGLMHGGPLKAVGGISTDDTLTDCKPNYFSVMNYLYEFSVGDWGYVDRPLDYSESTVTSIDENNINDQVGIGQSSPVGLKAVIGGVDTSGNYQTPITATAGSSPVDYDRDNSTPNLSYSKNIHLVNILDCDKGAKQGTNINPDTLRSFSDWDNLMLNFRPSLFFLNGYAPNPATEAQHEITNDTLAKISAITKAPPPTPDSSTARSAVTVGLNATIYKGDTFTRSGSITDPFSTSFSATVDYGDGSGVNTLAVSNKVFNLSHVYVNSGIFKVIVTVTNNRGGVSTGSLTVYVSQHLGTIPVGVAVNPNTNLIYVTNNVTRTVSVVNGPLNIILITIPVAPGSTGIGVNPNTNMIYVANTLSSTVSVINGTTNTVANTIPVGNGPIGVGVNPVTNKIYVANTFENTVSVINGVSNTVVSTISVGSGPLSVSANLNTNKIYVANSGGSVSVINGTNDSIVTTIPTTQGVAGIGVNINTNMIYVTNTKTNTISVINGTTNTVAGTISVGNLPIGIGLNPVTNTIYAVNWKGNTTSVINGATNTVVNTIPVGNGPISVGVNAVTNIIYVTNTLSNTLSVINSTTNTVVSTIR